MTNRLTGHFDGKVIVPDEPVDLPLDQQLVLHVETAPSLSAAGTPGDEFLRAIQELTIPPDDLAQIERAIEAGCERVDEDGW